MSHHFTPKDGLGDAQAKPKSASPNWALALFLLILPWHVIAQSPATHFDVNDISFLWPAPKTQTDMNQLVSLDELLSDGSPILPDNLLSFVLDNAQKNAVTASSGAVLKIAFPDIAFQQAHTWKVVGMRIDPSAPGVDPVAIALFGSSPQVRLIVQPVTLNSNGTPRINDFAMHLVFDFIAGFEPVLTPQGTQRVIPDKDAFRSVLQSLQDIKAMMQRANIPTEGELDVHPGFRKQVPGFAEALKALVKKHLNQQRLAAIAFMGVRQPEPWIFFALGKQNGVFVPFPHPSLNRSLAQMLTFSGGMPVVPVPANKNLPDGVSTEVLFHPGVASRLDALLFPGTTHTQTQTIKFRDVPDIIANPGICNFPFAKRMSG
jgi:hypothetical protein